MPVDRLEKALVKTEGDADATLKAATAAVGALKKFRAAVRLGNLRDLRKTIEAADKATTACRQQFVNAKEGWDFDEDAYLSSGDFYKELLETARQKGVNIFEQDERLYCYPLLIRLLPGEQSVLVDKAKERRLRPSVLVAHLKELQNKPVRFKAEAFLECLFSAYSQLVSSKAEDLLAGGPVIHLSKVYRLLTLLPDQSKEYSLQEFGRDIYLLEEKGITRTKGGRVVRFPAARGTRSGGVKIRVIRQDGGEKLYFGICFDQDGS